MTNVDKIRNLANRFQTNLDYYKETRNNYNEHPCRIEYIDPLLKILGWDVANERGLAPQYREVIAENYSTSTDRPDYTMTLKKPLILLIKRYSLMFSALMLNGAKSVGKYGKNEKAQAWKRLIK